MISVFKKMLTLLLTNIPAILVIAGFFLIIVALFLINKIVGLIGTGSIFIFAGIFSLINDNL